MRAAFLLDKTCVVDGLKQQVLLPRPMSLPQVNDVTLVERTNPRLYIMRVQRTRRMRNSDMRCVSMSERVISLKLLITDNNVSLSFIAFTRLGKQTIAHPSPRCLPTSPSGNS